MRARTLLAAGAITAVLAGCSRPGSDGGLVVDDEAEVDPRAEFELALKDDDAASVPLVSAIEVPQPEKQPQVRSTKARASAGRAETAPSKADHAEHQVVVAEPAAELAGVALAAATPVRSVGRISADPPRTSDTAAAGGEADAGRDGEDGGGVVIIRGGRGSGLDPCAVHTLRRPPAGAFINDRAPRIGFSPRGGLR